MRNKKTILFLCLLLSGMLILTGCTKSEAPETETPAAEIQEEPAQQEEIQTAAEEPAEAPAPESDPQSDPEPEPQTETPAVQPEVSSQAAEEPQSEPDPEPETEKIPAVTFSISCETAIASDELDDSIREVLPADGWILGTVTVEIEEGESVFDVLQRVCSTYGIALEHSKSPVYNSAYIEGIGHLYEFDCGNLSGWEYSVNGWYPNYGCSNAFLTDGDVVCWKYTCDLGKDIGAY